MIENLLAKQLDSAIEEYLGVKSQKDFNHYSESRLILNFPKPLATTYNDLTDSLTEKVREFYKDKGFKTTEPIKTTDPPTKGLSLSKEHLQTIGMNAKNQDYTHHITISGGDFYSIWVTDFSNIFKKTSKSIKL